VRRTRFARNGGLRIAYELRGQWHWRRPWLVLIQGLGFDRSGWQPVLRLLGRRFRLVLVDNRGSGRSELAGGSFSVRDMAADVVAVLNHARVARAHVLGLSLGGMVAQELAVDCPERVDGLVLVSTTPGWPFAYPMPAASVWVFAAARRMPPAEALRRHTENALSTATLDRHPELVGQLVGLLQSRPGQRRRGHRLPARRPARRLGSDRGQLVLPRSKE
jgi:pimeloyl-ACP methyl ester carboxylesterase